MFIRTEATPNPNSLKFYPGKVVIESGSYEFSNLEETNISQLASELFNIGNINNVFYGYDFIVVTKNDNVEWSILKPEVFLVIASHYSSNRPLFDVDNIYDNDDDELNNDIGNYDDIISKYNKEEAELVNQVIEILELYVRPRVMEDGGDVRFRLYKEGIVYLKMKGACSSCPSAIVTLKQGIKNLLTTYIPDIIDVEAVE